MNGCHFFIAVALLCCFDPAAHADRTREELLMPVTKPSQSGTRLRIALARERAIELIKKSLEQVEALNAKQRGNNPEADAFHDAHIKRCKDRIEKMEL